MCHKKLPISCHWLAVGLLISACVSSNGGGEVAKDTPPSGASESGTVSVTGPSSSELGNLVDAQPPSFVPPVSTTTVGAGRYVTELLVCCAVDEGETCCSNYPNANRCARNGGLYGKCTPEGANLEGKIYCAYCCNGLARVHMYEPDPTDPTVCVASGPISLFVCTACGDGVCGNAENWCNCPEDCQSPSDADVP